MKLREAARWAVHLGNNRISQVGLILTTSSGLTLALFWLLELTSARPIHPYAGIALFLVLPVLFVAGLALIPLGFLRHRRGLLREGPLPLAYPKVDLNAPGLRNALVFVALATLVNGAIVGTATFKGIEYMDSSQFCGMSCHTVMAPEYTAFVDSPHSRVGCVQCHIGPGAGWFVKSKLAGVHQVFAVTFKSYPRPILSPVHELRPARETCEQCHWPQKFLGDKFLVLRKYESDEANTPTTTVLILKVGGRTFQASVGIHGRHLYPGERVSYLATDRRREVIPRVVYREDDGALVEYVSEEVKVPGPELERVEKRTMDCIDCHNRPSHAFELPERAVDRAITEGRMSRELPFVKKKAVELLRKEYADRGSAQAQLPQALADYYRTSYPPVYRQHRTLVEAAGSALWDIYARNVFPDMKVSWGTHPNHLGHEDFLGCFRCHDENHKAKDGRTITQACDACHTILAQDETNPKILQELGL